MYEINSNVTHITMNLTLFMLTNAAEIMAGNSIFPSKGTGGRFYAILRGYFSR